MANEDAPNEDPTPQSFDDWITDFASTPKTDAELQALHIELVGEDNRESRQLVAEVQCMRWAARVLLERLREVGAWPGEGRENAVVRTAVWWLEQRGPTSLVDPGADG